jgi:hypothetical protein
MGVDMGIITRISGYTAITLAGLYGFSVLIFPFFLPSAFNLITTDDFTIAYWSTVFALFITFMVEVSLEHVRELRSLREMPAKGIEIFRSAQAFTDRLAEVTDGAEWVCTINFSPPLGSSESLDRYFRRVHGYISKKRSDLKSFRSIASIEDAKKAGWVADRAHVFLRNSAVSFSCFSEHVDNRLMCYHIVWKHGVGYTFLYPPIALTGVMDAFLILDNDVANLMQDQFKLAWERAVPVLSGGHPQEKGLQFLQDQGVELEYPSLKALRIAAGRNGERKQR